MVYSGEMKLSSKDTQDAVDLNYLHVELSIVFFLNTRLQSFNEPISSENTQNAVDSYQVHLDQDT